MSHPDVDVTKRPQQVFDLTSELLATLQPLSDQTRGAELDTREPDSSAPRESGRHQMPATSCNVCLQSFASPLEQREHFRSDWHGYNARQHLRGQAALSENDFERIVGDLDSSISGSEISDDENERATDSNAFGTAVASNVPTPDPKHARTVGSPLVLVGSSLLPHNTSVGMYKALLPHDKRNTEDAVQYLRAKQLRSPGSAHQTSTAKSSAPGGPRFFLCMIGGGHFAAMVVTPAATSEKQRARAEQLQPEIIAHKTFHRYTTRRKQGGAQSANDASKGNAHSAGAGIRRHNEMALQSEVRTLLHDWRELIGSCELLFVRANGPANRRTMFGAHEKSVLLGDDPRLRSFPFSTRRPVRRELLRAFQELVTIKFVRYEASLPSISAGKTSTGPTDTSNASKVKESPKLSEQEEEALLHTTQLQALVKRNKAPGVVSYLQKNGLTADFAFYPSDSSANHHAPRPLHLAAKLGTTAVVSALLTKATADPALKSTEGRTAYDLTSDRATKDAFKIARFELGEERWDWKAAHCPSPLSWEQVGEQAKSEQQQERKLEAERRAAEVRRIAASEQGALKPGKEGPKASLIGQMSAADAREQEARGLPPELRAKLEREKRARAAEERLKRLTLS